MHPDHEHLLVVAPVENANVTAIRQVFHAAPEVIMVKFISTRGLEGIQLAALRVDARHDVLDGALLAGGVHGLKNQQHGPFVLGVKLVMQLRKSFNGVK
jgi:hypothetical protein